MGLNKEGLFTWEEKRSGQTKAQVLPLSLLLLAVLGKPIH